MKGNITLIVAVITVFGSFIVAFIQYLSKKMEIRYRRKSELIDFIRNESLEIVINSSQIFTKINTYVYALEKSIDLKEGKIKTINDKDKVLIELEETTANSATQLNDCRQKFRSHSTLFKLAFSKSTNHCEEAKPVLKLQELESLVGSAINHFLELQENYSRNESEKKKKELEKLAKNLNISLETFSSSVRIFLSNSKIK